MSLFDSCCTDVDLALTIAILLWLRHGRKKGNSALSETVN